MFSNLIRSLLLGIVLQGISVSAVVAQPKQEVDVALVLAVDASYSINADAWALQRYGYAAAFRSQDILHVIRQGAYSAIAVTIVQWTRTQKQVVGWHVIRDAESAEVFARKIENLPYSPASYTGVSGAIDFSSRLLMSAPFNATRLIIDISGDGSDNTGARTWQARDTAVASGITINGLVIIGAEEAVPEFYDREVIGGPGSFLVVADGFDEFRAAIHRKLILEIAKR